MLFKFLDLVKKYIFHLIFVVFTTLSQVSSAVAEVIEMACVSTVEGQIAKEFFKYEGSSTEEKEIYIRKNNRWLTGCLKQGYQNYYKPCKIKIYDRGAVIEYFLKVKQVVENGQLKLSNGYTHNMEVKFLLDFDFLTFSVVNHVKNKDGTISFMQTPNITDFKCKMKNFKSE